MARKRVLVAMSGGVDSSVTAYVLQQQGYECIGATMRLTCSRTFGDDTERSCCSLADLEDAEAVCARLGIPWQAIDFRETFSRAVIDKFVSTYEQGRTPNPCIDCNRYLKFGALLDRAREMGCDFVATGHYARVSTLDRVLAETAGSGRGSIGGGAGRDIDADAGGGVDTARSIAGVAPCGDAAGTAAGSPADGGRPSSGMQPQAPAHPADNRDRAAERAVLRRIAELAGAPVRTLSLGVDPAKDQSYVLYALTQERLAHTLLPLGGLVKERDVRKIAREQGFSNAAKRDSQGICFVPDGDFARYIEKRRGHALPAGDIVDAHGRVLGMHRGAIRYTVGQRKGLGVACAHPVYVTGIDARANTVTLGENDELMASALIADDWIWSAPASAMEALLDEAGDAGVPVSAKIRYHHPSHACRMYRAENGIRLAFTAPERAIAPGQAVVVYALDTVLGGGTVREVPRG